jgi:hypothetical protein
MSDEEATIQDMHAAPLEDRPGVSREARDDSAADASHGSGVV